MFSATAIAQEAHRMMLLATIAIYRVAQIVLLITQQFTLTGSRSDKKYIGSS